MISNDDLLSYRRHQSIESQFSSPIERGPAYNKYLLSAYLFFRSRLAVPGRAYDTDDAGMLAIGGSAHCDILDLETFLTKDCSDEDRAVAYWWMVDSSQDEVAQLRRSRGYSRPSMHRKREALVEKAASSMAAAA